MAAFSRSRLRGVVAVGLTGVSTPISNACQCSEKPPGFSDSDRIRRRTVRFEGMKNVRDLGGLGKMPSGILFRADDPMHSTAADKLRATEQLKLKTVIDLRADMEVEKGFSDFGAPNRVLCDMPPDAKKNIKTTGAQVQQCYTEGPAGMARANEIYLEVGKKSLARAFRTLAKPDALPALFHCSLGKDRTGLLAMMLLNLAGASDEDIAADFALTAENTPITPQAVTRVQKWMEMLDIVVDDEGARNLLAAEPETALLTLGMIRRVHGSVELYLRNQLDLSSDEISNLRKAIITHGGETNLHNIALLSAGVCAVGLIAYLELFR